MPSKSEPGGQERRGPLRPHRHEPNPEPPSADPSFRLIILDRPAITVSVADLQNLPFSRIEGCYIVSTGHGTSGPFTFGGAAVADLLQNYLIQLDGVRSVEVMSDDGFGTRIDAGELRSPRWTGDFLLAYEIDGRPLTREEGLVRLIVPQERDDALRQVKWIALIRVLARSTDP